MDYHKQTVEVLIDRNSDIYRRIAERAEKDGVSVVDVVNMALLLRANVAIEQRLDELDGMEGRRE